MSERLDVDVCVIGAVRRLSVAAGASQLGMSTVLIERGRMGGDCLNYGCVPSKSLLAAAKRVKAARGNAAFGLGDAPPAVDFAAVMRHVQQVIAAIAPRIRSSASPASACASSPARRGFRARAR